MKVIAPILASGLSSSRLSLAATTSDNASSSSSSSTFAFCCIFKEEGGLKLRRFDVERDLPAITNICRNVYGGKDYLPNTAPDLAKDPNNIFMVLTVQQQQQEQQPIDNEGCASNNETNTDQPVAVGNAKQNMLPNMVWLEAIRTCPEHRGKGLAKLLTQSLIQASRQVNPQTQIIFTCTVESNRAMRKVLETVGMKTRHTIHQVQFSVLTQLPGWAARTSLEESAAAAQSFLQALKLEPHIRSEAKQQQYLQWIPVTTQAELDTVLQQVKQNGGIGYLPALYKLLSTDKILQALTQGLVWKLQSRSDDGNGGDSSSAQAAVIAFSNDEQIQSLKSSRICSIAATTHLALESALWFACSDKVFSLLQQQHHDDTSTNFDSSSRAFTIAVDGAVPLDGSNALCRAIPFVDDPCLLLGTN